MRKDFLVFGKPVIGNDEILNVSKTLLSGWWGTGPRTEEFEKKFAKYVQSNYALAVNSCTAGLHLALKAVGVGMGDEVITSPMTFCATANVIIHSGATPIFADIDKTTWNIDPREIEKKITPKTKAIIPVHLHGRPCDMESILRIARKHKLKVIEDAAHAIETVYKGRKIGSIGDVTVFSFYVTKNIATAEGGMVTTNNRRLLDKMKVMSLHGLSRDAYKRYSVEYFRQYECVTPGYKYNMTDLQASLGLAQFARIRKNARIRKKHWERYNRAFKDIDGLVLPAVEEAGSYHARHLYALLLPLEKLRVSRNEFIDQMIKRKIGSGVHFYPVHLHKYYRKSLNYRRGDFPNAEYIGDRTVSLPLGANLSDEDINDVIEVVNDVLKSSYK